MKTENHVFITGVSSGLGNGLAEYYLDIGWHVWGCSRRTNEDLIAKGGDRFHFQSVDLAETYTARDKINSFLSSVPHLDLAILNAGLLGEVKDLADQEIEDIKTIMDINLWANKWVIDELIRLEPKPSHIVAISSGASVNGNRGWGGYSLSKAALNMLMKIYAEEVEDVHFTSLAPGLIDSPMQDYLTTVPDADRFDSIQRLRNAKGTEDMPDPIEAGIRIGKAIPLLKSRPSGSFQDVRKM